MERIVELIQTFEPMLIVAPTVLITTFPAFMPDGLKLALDTELVS
jgi:hypothetical protein